MTAVLANAKALQGTWLGLLSYASVLHYFFELVMSNELLGQLITVSRRYPGDPGQKHTPVSGHMIVHDYLGFNHYDCARVLPIGDDPMNQISACWLDLYVPVVWYAFFVVLSIVLLKFCVRDPH